MYHPLPCTIWHTNVICECDDDEWMRVDLAHTQLFNIQLTPVDGQNACVWSSVRSYIILRIRSFWLGWMDVTNQPQWPHILEWYLKRWHIIIAQNNGNTHLSCGRKNRFNYVILFARVRYSFVFGYTFLTEHMHINNERTPRNTHIDFGSSSTPYNHLYIFKSEHSSRYCIRHIRVHWTRTTALQTNTLQIL